MPDPDMSVWTGRVDTADGPRALRWHQMVEPLRPDSSPGIALVGFACDEGVRRNKGRVGAKDGPRAIRTALANLAWHQKLPVYDAGDVRCDDGDLVAAQSRLGEAVSGLVTDGQRPLILGGGHETAWGTFLGIVDARPRARIGVVNIDAHLDLRADEEPNSGTPFAQIARWCAANRRPFNYLCLGAAEPSNTAALLERAEGLGATVLTDICLPPWDLVGIHGLVAEFAQSVDLVHLSIDLDVLPGSVMPAVSAPAAAGVPLASVEPLVGRLLSNGNTIAVDLVELNPALDPGHCGARVAARLAWHVAHVWAQWSSE